MSNFLNEKKLSSPILITGAGGCIGSWVISLLAKTRVKIIAMDLSSETKRLNYIIKNKEIKRIKWIVGDVSNKKRIEQIVKKYKIKSIIHLAALQIPFCAKDPLLGAKVNVLGTVNIFEVAKKFNIKKIVYTSSVAAHGLLSNLYKPTLYGSYKLCNENVAKVYFHDFNISSIGFRPGIAYGVGRDQGMTSKTTTAILAAVLNKTYTIPFSGKISALYNKEIASALIRGVSIKHKGCPIFDINGEKTTVEKWVKIIKNIHPKAKIKIKGDKLPFPFEASDRPLRKYIGNYEKISLQDGIRETYELFIKLLNKGHVFKL